jgi:fatty acid desaturase
MVFRWLDPGFRNYADLRTVAWVALYYMCTALLWCKEEALAASSLRLPIWAAAVYLSFACACITHNTMHCRVFRKRWANQIFHVALSMSYGHPVSSYVPGHNLSHHKNTQLRKDIMRTSKMRWRWHLLNGLLFQPSVAGAVLKSDLRYISLQRALGRSFYLNVLREFAWVGVSFVALLVLDPRKFFAFWWLPHFFAQWAIVSVNVVQHDGCQTVPEGETLGAPGWRNHSRSFTAPLLNFLTFNNGYHAIHHMHPTSHWSTYPALHAKEIAPFVHPELNQYSMLVYIWRTFIYPVDPSTGAWAPHRRVDYLGNPIAFDADVEPEDVKWIAYPDDVDPAAIYIVSLAKQTVAGFFLAPLKLLNPNWSLTFGALM